MIYVRGGGLDGEDTQDRVLEMSMGDAQGLISSVRGIMNAPGLTVERLRTVISARLGSKWGAESRIYIGRILLYAGLFAEVEPWTREQTDFITTEIMGQEV